MRELTREDQEHIQYITLRLAELMRDEHYGEYVIPMQAGRIQRPRGCWTEDLPRVDTPKY